MPTIDIDLQNNSRQTRGNTGPAKRDGQCAVIYPALDPIAGVIQPKRRTGDTNILAQSLRLAADARTAPWTGIIRNLKKK
jgi:hypothetical protein